MKIDHVGIAVEDIETAIESYKAFGLEVRHREDVTSQNVRVAFLSGSAGESSVELMEPLGDDGAVARFLAKRGPGLHHLAFETGDIAAEMKRLKDRAKPPMEDAPRPGARGHSVCFIHPKHCAGTLIELVG